MQHYDDTKDFMSRNQKAISEMGSNEELAQLTQKWMIEGQPYEYSYHFSWMGLPIIQYPQDMMAMQEIIWQVKPNLIIETGVARGGSLIFYSSMLEICGGGVDDALVIGIDIDIRAHNRKNIEAHPMSKRIKLVEGSSTDESTLKQVKELSGKRDRVMVVLDSMHTHSHVLQELELYSPFVSKDSYLVVFDTVIEDMPKGMFSNRPWDVGNNPKTAVYEFLKSNHDFEIDKSITDKLLITVAPSGYLKRVS